MAEGHRERLKRRFLNEGLRNFEDYQALELLLFYAIPRKDTSPIARALIQRFGSFSAVLDAPLEELKKVEGMGDSSATFLKMLPAMSAYYMTDLCRFKKQITSTREAGEYLVPQFIGKTKESVYLLCLDKSGRILYGDFINEGTVDLSSLSPRMVAEVALRIGATGVILAHNHPRGFALPSNSDVSSTNELHRTLHALGIELLDHLIVAENDYISLQESHLISL
ncbi:MAG: RadC family protein [Oscillospiraceae bacterium]|nr:RadC family protein [Oscillospiraceae bacterium]